MDYVGYRRLYEQAKDNDFKVTAEILGLFGFGESYSGAAMSSYMAIVNLLATLSADGVSPYLIGVAGSVAVGKSTTSRILKYLLETRGYKVALVPTDGFLHSNDYLAKHNLEQRKGFPESYDMKKLLGFLTDLKQGRGDVTAPCYSHHIYDIVQSGHIKAGGAEIVILEGLNVLQNNHNRSVSDFVDFGIYVDADTLDITSWFLTRFMMYRDMAKNDPSAYFYNFKSFSDDEAAAYATAIWENINLANLNINILPSRENADMIIAKDSSHCITDVYIKE